MIRGAKGNEWASTGQQALGAKVVLRFLLTVLCLLGIANGQKLAPGNRIQIVCEQEPTLSVERTISPAGEITLPLLGRIVIAGRSVTEAEGDLESRAAAKLGLDRVLVSISLLDSPNGPVEFFGAVIRNGSIPFHPGLTLEDVMTYALSKSAPEGDSVEITGANGKRIIVDVSEAAITLMRPGDRVFFPRSTVANEVYILGGVERPGAKTFTPGMTLRSLIQLAGGISGHGLPDKIKLERKGGETTVVTLDSGAAETQLVRGDVVTVPTVESGRFVTVSGVVMRPGVVEFREGMRLTEAIKAAGGAGMFSSGEITVKRIGLWKRSYNLGQIRSKKTEDPLLAAGDIVDVQSAKWRKTQDSNQPPPKERKHPVVPPN